MGFGRLSCNLQKSGKHLRNGPKLLFGRQAAAEGHCLLQAPPKNRSTPAVADGLRVGKVAGKL